MSLIGDIGREYNENFYNIIPSRHPAGTRSASLVLRSASCVDTNLEWQVLSPVPAGKSISAAWANGVRLLDRSQMPGLSHEGRS